MPHFPKPFWRGQTSSWYVQIGDVQHALGADWPEALRQYALLLAGETAPISSPGVKLTDAICQFLDDCRARLSPRTVQWYAERLCWMSDTLEPGITLQKVTPASVMAWAMSPKQDWSPSYRHGLLTAAGRLTAWCTLRGLLTADPLAGKLTKPTPASRSRVLAAVDFARLLSIYPAGDTFRDLLILCWETGCRPQEALRFEVSHYQSLARRLSLPAVLAKGKLRARHVYLSNAGEDVVVRLVAGRGAGVLLLNEDGVPWTRHAVACRFARAARVLGVHYRLYDLRHSFAHRMLAAGVAAASVAQLMGHVDTQMVLRVYGHLEAADQFLRGELRRGEAG